MNVSKWLFSTILSLAISLTSVFCGVVDAQTVKYSVQPLTSPFTPPGRISGRQLNIRHWIPLTDNLYGRPSQPFVWRWGKPFPITLLGGTCGTADGINDYGHIVGSACLPGETLPHAYFYKDKTAVDLGTFGGISADATNVNLSRQVAGNYQLSDGSVHGFEWERKRSVDLGNLGGSYTFPLGINNSGVIVGQSYTSDVSDPLFGVPHYHGFQWVGGVLTDFGQIFGSDYNLAFSINDAGMVAGSADTAGDLAAHAFIWHQGVIDDLTPGNFPGFNAGAIGINNVGQVVGIIGSVIDDPSFGPPADVVLCPCYGTLWQNGQETFLNDVVPAGWTIYIAIAINDRGYILAEGTYNGGRFQRMILRPLPIQADSKSTSFQRITLEDRANNYPASAPRILHHDRDGTWSAAH